MRMARMLAVLSFASAAPAQVAADPELAAAEALIDAFYSFDPERLRKAMAAAPDSAPALLYYQGWAEGGHYRVVKRNACVREKVGEVRCAITVKDDLIAALGTGYDVTDVFHVSFSQGKIVAVKNSSDDPPEFGEARKWLVATKPELLDGACKGFFAGGPTPGDCVREVVSGFRRYTAGKKAGTIK